MKIFASNDETFLESQTIASQRRSRSRCRDDSFVVAKLVKNDLTQNIVERKGDADLSLERGGARPSRKEIRPASVTRNAGTGMFVRGVAAIGIAT